MSIEYEVLPDGGHEDFAEAIFSKMKNVVDEVKAGTRAAKQYHLGFYLDANGDLCYDREEAAE